MAPPRVLLLLVVFSSALVATRAIAPNGNCELLYENEPIIPGSWDSFFNVANYAGNLKDDTAPGDTHLELTTQEIASFSYVDNSASDYVDVVLDTGANTLSLVVKDKFTSYEEDMVAATQPNTIDITILFTCGDGNTQDLKLKITVEDVNTHRPVFDKPSYPYDLPMPLPSDFDLSCLVGVISVQDIDFSNDAITIQFDKNGDQLFRAEVTYQSNRNYNIQLYSKTTLELKETTDFTMTAVDSGNPPLESEPVTITITVDQETSPPTAPVFDQAAQHKPISTEDIEAGGEIASVKILEGYDEGVQVTHYTVHDEGLTPPMTAFRVQTTADGNGGATVSLQWEDGVTVADIQDFKYALIVVQAERDRGTISAKQIATTVIHLTLPGFDEQTTACPTNPTTTTVEPTECPIPEPCPSTVPTTTSEACPSPEPCEPCTSTAEPTQCPSPEPCEPCTSTAEPTQCPSTVPCEPCTSTAEPTQCPSPEPCSTSGTDQSSSSTSPASPTDPTWWPTTLCPECNCSDTTDQTNSPVTTECPTVGTTASGSTIIDCSQCPVTESPQTSPITDSPTDCTECPNTCPSSPPTSPDTGSTIIDCSQCPVTESPQTSSITHSPTDCTECPNTCPSTSPTSPNTVSPSDCPVTCEPCPSASTAPPPDPEIEFEKNSYLHNMRHGLTGMLLDLQLKEPTLDGYRLECNLDATDYVASKVSVEAVGTTVCQLSAYDVLDTGSYSFMVVASLEGTSSTATAKVALDVLEVIACDDFVFSDALQVVDRLEEQEQTESITTVAILPEDIQCCFYGTVDPVANTDWVHVNQSTGEITMTDLDYENVTSLVITVSVSSCEQEQQQLWWALRDLHRKGQPKWWPRDLSFDTTKTTVLLQIQDINDNDPEFTTEDHLVLGYPTGDLLERVQPGPVVTLDATDADEGVNAELHYSLDAGGSRYFSVQPQTGAVYLRADAPELPATGISFSATVADRAGDAEARSNTITLQVKPLESEELVLVVTVDDALPEEADAVVRDLSNVTGLAVRLLRAYAGMSENTRAAPATRADSTAVGASLTLLLYALDDQDRLVTVDQFQKLLSSLDGNLPWSVSKVENLPAEPEDQAPTDVTGYLVGIIVLAVLIVLAAVGAGAGYYFYVRPRMGAHKAKDGYTEFPSDSEKSSPLESQIPQITTTVEPNVSTISEIIEPVKQPTAENNFQTHADSTGALAPSSEDDWSRKRSMTIRGGPDDYHDTEAPGGQRQSESSDSLDGEEAQTDSERRKSTVHFNENVECIEVDRL